MNWLISCLLIYCPNFTQNLVKFIVNLFTSPSNDIFLYSTCWWKLEVWWMLNMDWSKFANSMVLISICIIVVLSIDYWWNKKYMQKWNNGRSCKGKERWLKSYKMFIYLYIYIYIYINIELIGIMPKHIFHDYIRDYTCNRMCH
jgi:hypothetical protein